MTSSYGDPKDYPRTGDNGPYALGGFRGKGRKKGIVRKIVDVIRKK